MAIAQNITLQQMIDEVYEVNLANGWWEGEEQRAHDDDIALLHSEVSEALEAYRRWELKDATAELGQHRMEGSLPKPEGVGSELADVLIRLLDYAKRYNISGERLSRHAPRVMPDATFLRFTSYVNAMHNAIYRLEMVPGAAAAGELLGLVEAVAERCGIDLQAEYERKLAFNRTRGHRHGGKLL